jgi:hypothetical protein
MYAYSTTYIILSRIRVHTEQNRETISTQAPSIAQVAPARPNRLDRLDDLKHNEHGILTRRTDQL